MAKQSGVSKRSIVPLGDKVLLKELKEDKKSRSGIILSDSVDQSKGLKEAKVIAVGEGKYVDDELVELYVKKGDIVLFGWGEKLEFDGEEYYLVRESEISARIESK